MHHSAKPRLLAQVREPFSQTTRFVSRESTATSAALLSATNPRGKPRLGLTPYSPRTLKASTGAAALQHPSLVEV